MCMDSSLMPEKDLVEYEIGPTDEGELSWGAVWLRSGLAKDQVEWSIGFGSCGELRTRLLRAE